jgi:SSS family solute:Na+ symporter
VDIYSTYINKNASDIEKIESGRKAIIFSFFTALLMSMILLYLKFDDPDSAFTHTLNNLRYYINCGIVVLICSSVLLLKPSKNSILTAFLITIPLNISLQYLFPEMNYFLRAFWVIFSGLLIALIFNLQKIQNLYKLTYVSSKNNLLLGCFLLISLIIIHIIFH